MTTDKNVRAEPGSGVKHDKHAPTSGGVKHDKHAPCSRGEVAVIDETESDAEENEVPTMDNTKAEILEYCAEHEIEVNGGWSKAELLEAIDES